MLDTSKFKERFNKWKQGLPVYKNGKPISDEVSYNTPERNFQEAIDYAASSKKINTTKLPKFGNGMTPDTIKQFVNNMSPKVYKALIRRGIKNPDVVHDHIMRQFSHESLYGTSRQARVNHNYAGVGYNGSSYYHYDSDEEFIEDYLNLMQKRYGSALAATNIDQWAAALKDKGYYEDTLQNYSRGLKNVKTAARMVQEHKQQHPEQYTGKYDFRLPEGYKPQRERKDNTRVSRVSTPEQAVISNMPRYIDDSFIKQINQNYTPLTQYQWEQNRITIPNSFNIVPRRSIGIDPDKYL